MSTIKSNVTVEVQESAEYENCLDLLDEEYIERAEKERELGKEFDKFFQVEETKVPIDKKYDESSAKKKEESVFKSVNVSFRNKEDMNEFCELIGQQIVYGIHNLHLM